MPCKLTDAQRARLAERSVIRQDNFGDVDLPRLPEIPGMSSAAEGRYLYWLTSRGYTGCGAVVEIGPWLGRSTVHLAAGGLHFAPGPEDHEVDRSADHEIEDQRYRPGTGRILLSKHDSSNYRLVQQGGSSLRSTPPSPPGGTVR